MGQLGRTFMQVSKLHKCHVCKQHKPASDFFKTKSRKSGVSSRCKVCEKVYHRNYMKGYLQTERGKEVNAGCGRRQYHRRQEEFGYHHADVLKLIPAHRMLEALRTAEVVEI